LKEIGYDGGEKEVQLLKDRHSKLESNWDPVMPHLTTQPTILVVDADEVACQFACAALQSHGYQTIPAADIAAAIWTASDSDLVLDLILCDLQVDQQMGSDIVDAIQRLPFRNDLPAMFTSQHQVTDVVLKRHAKRGAYHIKKPYDVELLMDLVDRSLWMPHLVSSHIEKHHAAQPLPVPHAAFSTVQYPSAINTTSFVN
jgi:DNA-binding NtrC family response regulator